MRTMNRIFLVGRLGQDPELRKAKNGGEPWTTLSLATDRFRREGDQWVGEAEWHRVKVFGPTAEACHRLLRKGGVAAVEGRLTYDKWTAHDGTPRVTAQIMADRVSCLEAARAPEQVEQPVATA